VMVPVLITGSFASPKIRPDLKGLIGGGTAGGLNPEDLKKQILGGQDGEKPPIETQKEEVKKQLKSLFPGITD
jgi:AsmA protein